jgi:hypothetical protein
VTGAFFWFWLIRCHFSDLQSFLTQVLEAPVDVVGDVRAKILFHAAWAESAAGDKTRRAQLIEESLTLYRTLVQQSPAELSLQRGLIAALNGAGHIALSAGEYPDLERLCEESLALCRQAGERWRPKRSTSSRSGTPGVGRRPEDVPSAKRASPSAGNWGKGAGPVFCSSA